MLGAKEHIDSSQSEPGAELAGLGGAGLIVSTSSSSSDVSRLLPGLRVRGELALVGVDGCSLTIPVSQLVMKGQTVSGHLTGSASDIEETMRFAMLNGVRPLIEKMPLTDANEAVQRLAEGKARFRIVLDPKDVK